MPITKTITWYQPRQEVTASFLKRSGDEVLFVSRDTDESFGDYALYKPRVKLDWSVSLILDYQVHPAAN